MKEFKERTIEEIAREIAMHYDKIEDLFEQLKNEYGISAGFDFAGSRASITGSWKKDDVLANFAWEFSKKSKLARRTLYHFNSGPRSITFEIRPKYRTKSTAMEDSHETK